MRRRPFFSRYELVSEAVVQLPRCLPLLQNSDVSRDKFLVVFGRFAKADLNYISDLIN